MGEERSYLWVALPWNQDRLDTFRAAKEVRLCCNQPGARASGSTMPAGALNRHMVASLAIQQVSIHKSIYTHFHGLLVALPFKGNYFCNWKEI